MIGKRRNTIPPSREAVRELLEREGFEYLGPSLPEDHPEYEPPPKDFQIVVVQFGGLLGLYRARKRPSVK